MTASARLLARAVCVMALSACADTADPIAPRAEGSADALPALSIAPTPEELAEMPPEFAAAPTIDLFSTTVSFESQTVVSALGYMTYLATDASQDLSLRLRFEHQEIAATEAHGEQSDWLPWTRTLVTTARLGLSGGCGHLADATTNHKAWHEFLVGGWKFLSWGNQGKSSGDSAAQPACPEPPPSSGAPGGGGGGQEEYDGDCLFCQEWLYYFDGHLVDRWWECEPTDESWCDNLMG